MVFFNMNREIVQSVQKKFNRVVVWNASLDYNMKQPGFQTFETEYSLLIKLTRDKRKVKQGLDYVQVYNLVIYLSFCTPIAMNLSCAKPVVMADKTTLLLLRSTMLLTQV